MPIRLDTYMNQADAIDPSRHPDLRQSYDEGRAAALAWFVHAEAASHYTPEQASREYLDYLRAVIDENNVDSESAGHGS